MLIQLYLYIGGWPKKVSNYHESSLNRIKTRHQFRLQNEHKNMISLY